MNDRFASRKSSRSDVLWWLASFVVLQIGLAIALDYPLSFLRDPGYVTRAGLLREARKNTAERPFVVILGSSRTLYGFCPVQIPNDAEHAEQQPIIFNFSQYGHGPTHQYAILHHLLRDNLRPDGIVLELIPHQLTHDLSENDYIGILKFDRFDLPHHTIFRSDPAAVRREWLEARLVPSYTFRFHLMDRFLSGWIPYNFGPRGWRNLDSLGWSPIVGDKPSEQARANAREGMLPTFANYQIADGNRLAIRLIAEVCRKEQIPLTVLFMPESPEFRSWYSEKARTEIRGLVDWMRNDLSVQVVDAREWLNSEEYFLDGHHLLTTGASEFTACFARRVAPALANLSRKSVIAKAPQP